MQEWALGITSLCSQTAPGRDTLALKAPEVVNKKNLPTLNLGIFLTKSVILLVATALRGSQSLRRRLRSHETPSIGKITGTNSGNQ